MPGPAFVPADLRQAEGRSWRQFYPRQARGLAWGLAGGIIGALTWGVRSPAGFMATALLALPGFASGFYMPAGRPLEWWARVLWRYYTTPQVATMAGRRSRRRSSQPLRRKENGHDGSQG